MTKEKKTSLIVLFLEKGFFSCHIILCVQGLGKQQRPDLNQPLNQSSTPVHTFDIQAPL